MKKDEIIKTLNEEISNLTKNYFQSLNEKIKL